MSIQQWALSENKKGEKWVMFSTCMYQCNEVCARNSSDIPKLFVLFK